MQFNVAGKANARDYIAAGKAGAAAVRNNFIAARKNSPDYGGLGTININARSAERRAATEAEAKVKKVGLQALAETEVAQIKGDALVKNAKRKAGATRMAGLIGGLAMAAGGAYLGIENKRAAKRQAEQDAKADARAEKELEILGQMRNRESTYEPTKFDEGSVDMSDLPELQDLSTLIPGEQTTPSINTPTEAEAPTTPPVAQQSAPLSSSDSGVGKLAARYDKEQLKGFARNAGFPEHTLEIVSKIAMGESSGNPRALNQKGDDDSYGLMQINMINKPGYRLGDERMAKFGLKSKEDLYDPQTNFNAAYQIYKEQGLGAWGAYTNGSYQNYQRANPAPI